MPHRVREVLLVSSPYEAFILEKDGLLSEQVFFEYREVNLSAPPRFTHVSTGREALEALRRRRYDLILTRHTLTDMDVEDFGRAVKRLRPGRPVVLLGLDRRELGGGRTFDPDAIDKVFLWSGDAQILLAIIKFIEDRENVEHDVKSGGVRVIIVIEDSPRYYSTFLGMLYGELMAQSAALYSEGANELYRRMSMRSRPKVLLATSYEEGIELLERYRRNLMAVISDVAIPRGGVTDPEAGIQFVKRARSEDPELPVLLQSAEPGIALRAVDLETSFVDKSSHRLLAEVSRFLNHQLGFGDFVFRIPSGDEVDRARNLREFVERLATIPDESLVYHARHNHFSLWLMARSEFGLAEELRPRSVSEFPSVAATREFLLGLMRESRRRARDGAVSDFGQVHFADDAFSRLGQGALGGKGRGLAFMNQRLADLHIDEVDRMQIRMPKTVVIATDQFDAFLDLNDLRDFAASCDDDAEISRRFVESPLPESLQEQLGFLVEELPGPLAVRSSSLLEDSMHQPFAGIFATLMLANTQMPKDERIRELATAIRLVYASTFSSDAKAYLRNIGIRVEEERMAVVLQNVVGRRHAERFYPDFAGVAHSHNFYPVGPQEPGDGVVRLCLGLGNLVVEGDPVLVFSPRHPGVVPQLDRVRTALDQTQRRFCAVDVRERCCADLTAHDSTVRTFELDIAEGDGTLQPVGSVLSTSEDRIRDDLTLPGPRIVTFNNVLRHRSVPLAAALIRLMNVCRKGFGGPVEIEFAGDLGGRGRPPALYILQVRPFSAVTVVSEELVGRFDPADVVVRSERTLGHGVFEEVHDVVFVRRDRWDPARSKDIAREVGMLNKRLVVSARPYVLIGPGRWGSADPWLGIPVRWSQISGVRVVVEASPAGYDVEPSQGTHFFHNLQSLQIGYVTIPPGARPGDDEFVDWDWLEAAPREGTTEFLVHVHLDRPLRILFDGRLGRASIARPEAAAPGESAPPVGTGSPRS